MAEVTAPACPDISAPFARADQLIARADQLIAQVDLTRSAPPDLAAAVTAATEAAVCATVGLRALQAALADVRALFDQTVPGDGTDAWEAPWEAWGCQRLTDRLADIEDLVAATNW